MVNKTLSFLAVSALLIGSFYYFLKQPAPVRYQRAAHAPVAEPVDTSVDIVFVGDIMLDRIVAKRAQEKGFPYLFENVKGLLSDSDLTIGNLEGSITEYDSIAQKQYGILRFTFATSTAQTLRDLGFDGVSLANNHANDFGREGYDQTRWFLSGANIFSFGSPLNDGKLSEKVSVKGKDLCFVGYHQLFAPDTTSVIAEIKAIRPVCDYIAVLPHWGEEYMDNENQYQKGIAHAFIDAGADVIVGAHPHVVQPIEVYNNKAIFYSLGNFMFDQDFSTETQQGLVVRMTLSDTAINYHLIPVALERSKLYYPEKENYQKRMDVLISKLPENLRTTASIDSEFVLSR